MDAVVGGQSYRRFRRFYRLWLRTECVANLIIISVICVICGCLIYKCSSVFIRVHPRLFSDNRSLLSDGRRLVSGDRRLRRRIPRLGIFLRRLLSFLRSLQNFLRSLLLTVASLQFWVSQVHWVQHVFVSIYIKVLGNTAMVGADG